MKKFISRKKYLIALIIFSLIISPCLLTGCGDKSSNKEQEEVISEEELDENERTLEQALYILEQDGYKLTDEGYKAVDFDDDVSSERYVSASGNHMTVKLYYNYNDGSNKKMVEFFKNEDEAVNVMLSSFLSRVGSEAEASEGDMDYEIYVGGSLARKGNMDISEAMEYSEYADE